MLALSDAQSPVARPAISAPLSARLAAMPKTPHAPHTPESFVRARFGCKLGPQIGSGGFGEVFRAEILTGGEWHQSHTPRVRGEQIAIKVTDASIDRTGDKPRQRRPSEIDTVLSDCAQEMACQAHFSHLQHVVGVFDTAVDGTRVYLAMQLGHHGDLYQIFSNAYMTRRAIPEADVKSWIGDILEALEGMAQEGYIHRDVKLENFLLDDSGHAMVSDFGYAAKTGEDGKIVSTHFAGTWESTAPEVMRQQGGIYSERSDVFALGVSLYELLTVTPSPFSRDWSSRKTPFDEQWVPNERMRRAMVEALPKHTSKAAADTLYAMLAPKAEDRPTFLELLQGSFFGRRAASSGAHHRHLQAGEVHEHHHPHHDEHKRARSESKSDGRRQVARADVEDPAELSISQMHLSDNSDRSLAASLSPARSARRIASAIKSPALSAKHFPVRV